MAPVGSPTAPSVTSPQRDEDSAPTGGHIPGIVATNVQDSPYKVYLGGLPPFLSAEQVRELVSTFGQLKSFHLVMDTTNPAMSKGYAFLEYLEDSVTDRACEGLNGMHIGDKTLTMHRASTSSIAPSSSSSSKFSDLPSIASPPSSTQNNNTLPNLPASNPLLTATLLGMPYMGPTSPPPPTHTLLLLNMATTESVGMEPEYQALLEDVRSECAKIGPVKGVVIPRLPGGGERDRDKGRNSTPSSMLVKVYVRYENKEDAYTAHQTLGGRRYNGRTIVSHFADDNAIPV